MPKKLQALLCDKAGAIVSTREVDLPVKRFIIMPIPNIANALKAFAGKEAGRAVSMRTFSLCVVWEEEGEAIYWETGR